jgi:hypothetical protein
MDNQYPKKKYCQCGAKGTYDDNGVRTCIQCGLPKEEQPKPSNFLMHSAGKRGPYFKY